MVSDAFSFILLFLFFFLHVFSFRGLRLIEREHAAALLMFLEGDFNVPHRTEVLPHA
jgi:hypothetical protein